MLHLINNAPLRNKIIKRACLVQAFFVYYSYERKYKVIVTGISKDQRQKLLIKKSTLKEEVDFDYGMYRMKKIAGL